MASLVRRGSDLVVVLSRWEKVEALRREVAVPRAAVVGVTVVDDVVHSLSGLHPRQWKLVGTYLPGRVAVGTFRDGGRRHVFAAVHREQRGGVRIDLDGARFGALLVSCADPAAERERLLAETR